MFSLLGDLFFNHKPIVVKYNSEYYFPFLFVYPESHFGGIFETETDYKDPEIKKTISSKGNWVLWAPIKFGPMEVDFNLSQPAPSPPDDRHWLGTDDRARDVLSRLVFGFRLSLFFGMLIALLGSFIGIGVGAVQGYFGGKVDLIGQRLIEIWSSLPELFILIILTSIFQPTLILITFLMAAMGWVGLAAYVRAEFLRAREYDYVQSAKALGASRLRVIFLHIFPNTLVPVITFFPFRVSAAITGLAALDFLGLGVSSHVPSLGELLSQGKSNLHSWWIIFSTFCVMVMLILMLNFIGESIRKAMDPKSIQK
ncbi:MAG: peptide ABC transporter permease [Zetaproteobacteria bacterium]|nr:peptide ABC transporter permease [Pseudobdellovibrionaceae bacterium]|tara:strand:+ start:976 stop:1911 length:936 start_codon:yes stop_codon:yes gene_type:complete